MRTSLKSHTGSIDQSLGPRLRIAVVGAGLAGLTAAHALSEQGHDVVILDKARGAGGRMSTRRQGAYRFDHGAQYFTARDPRFLDQLRLWQRDGLVQRWDGRIGAIDGETIRPVSTEAARYVGVPGMNAICRDLAEAAADCRFGWAVARVWPVANGWILDSGDGARLDADVLLLTTPPEQSTALVDEPALHSALEGVDLLPCWAVMVVFDRPLLVDWDAVFVNGGELSWIASQASKPGRPQDQGWVLHASPDWSRAHLEAEPADVIRALIAAAVRLPGSNPVSIIDATVHRWRYAMADVPLEAGALWFSSQRLAVAGDWCCGSRVEGAFLSGLDAARRIMTDPAVRSPER